MELREEILSIHNLCSGDRPSIYAAGLALAGILRSGRVAVFTVDVLGNVRIESSKDVLDLIPRPLVEDAELSKFSEQEAIAIMTAEGRSEDDIVQHFKRRRVQDQGEDILRLGALRSPEESSSGGSPDGKA